MTQTETNEWVVVRTLRVPATDRQFATAEDAIDKVDELSYGDPDADYSVAHITLPLDTRWAGFTMEQMSELEAALTAHVKTLHRERTDTQDPGERWEFDRRIGTANAMLAEMVA
jgi:hypothetical protein